MQDFNKLFNPDEIYLVQDEHRDPCRKEIGDRVDIMDFSSCTHLNGRELCEAQDEQMQFDRLVYFIVIATHQNHSFDAYFRTYKQNLVIVNPHNDLQYRINSGHVKLR